MTLVSTCMSNSAYKFADCALCCVQVPTHAKLLHRAQLYNAGLALAGCSGSGFSLVLPRTTHITMILMAVEQCCLLYQCCASKVVALAVVVLVFMCGCSKAVSTLYGTGPHHFLGQTGWHVRRHHCQFRVVMHAASSVYTHITYVYAHWLSHLQCLNT